MKNRLFSVAKVLAIIFVSINVIFPLIAVILNIKSEDISEVIQNASFAKMLLNSVCVTVCATIISVSLALLLSWCLNRSNVRYKNLFAVLFTVPMLIPSISHGVGLVLLLGENGILTRMFHLNFQLYGYCGLIMGSVLYSFPPAFLLLMDIFQYEDFTTYEAAEVLGVNKTKQFFIITLPNLKKTLISAVFATFTLIFTDYGVPVAVGGKIMTLPLYMYREVVGLLNFSKGAIIGVILLIPAVIAFIFDLKNKENENISTVTRKFEIKKNTVRDLAAYFICITTIILISLPILAFIYLSTVAQYPIDLSFSTKNIKNAFDLGVGRYLENSLAIALMTSYAGVTAAYFIAYLTARTGKKFTNSVLHLISLVTLAIPGIVLGLSYVLFFRKSFIYGTLVMLVLVNMVHFFASPYLLAYNSLGKFSSNLEDISATLGISKWHMIKDIYIPCTQQTIIEMFSYFFVNAMVTISAVSFLANFRNMPLALMIPRFDSQSLIEATAFVSVLILFVNGVMKLAVFFIKKRTLNEN